jgi:hypothetical protein
MAYIPSFSALIGYAKKPGGNGAGDVKAVKLIKYRTY